MRAMFLVVVLWLVGAMALAQTSEVRSREGSLAACVSRLGRLYDLPVEFRDERAAGSSTPRVSVQLTGKDFWADYGAVERAWHLSLDWEGARHVGDPAVIRAAEDKRLRLDCCYSGRYRVVLWEDMIDLTKSGQSLKAAELDFLPDEHEMIGARWIPAGESEGDVAWEGPVWGAVHYLGGANRDVKRSRLDGTVEVLVADKWKSIRLELKAGSEIAIKGGNGISSIKIARVGVTKFEGAPGSVMAVASDDFKAYVVQLEVPGLYPGLALAGEESGIVDSEGVLHTASDMGGPLRPGPGNPYHHVAVNRWEGTAKPAQLVLAVPVATHRDVLNLSQLAHHQWAGGQPRKSSE